MIAQSTNRRLEHQSFRQEEPATLRTLRLFRSLIVTGVIPGLAAESHLIGGGNLPTPTIIAAFAAPLLLPVTWLAGRHLSFSALLGLLGPDQLTLDEACAARFRQWTELTTQTHPWSTISTA